MAKCNVCGGTDFTITAGFYFCVECGTKSQDIQEFEYEFDYQNKSQHKSIIRKTTEKKEVHTPTTWEEYNYILIGMVNQLIDAGASDDIKLTALQLWTAYLKKMEVAFVSKLHSKTPKLGAYLINKDTKILYNYQRQKLKRPRSTKSSGTSGTSGPSDVSLSSSKIVRKTRKSLLKAEYERYKQSEGSLSINLSGSSGNHTSDSATSEKLLFSKYAQKTMKILRKRKRNPKSKEDEFITLKTEKPRNRDYDTPTRMLLYSILYMALNQCEDAIQLSDMIRFIREDHLAYKDIMQFFPENLRNNSLRKNFNAHRIMSHVYLREYVAGFVKIIKVKPILPNFLKLCKRYVEELNLPNDVFKLTAILITICPPKMVFKHEMARSLWPNYEGRAISYVIFILKLLFGLDDQCESILSTSAKQINEKLKQMNSDRKQLFVWNDWVQFVEMRKILLSECHFPTATLIRKDTSSYTNLYTDYLMKIRCAESEQPEAADKKSQTNEGIRLKNLQMFCDKVASSGKTKNKIESLSFPPTLTPFKTHLNNLLSRESCKGTLCIPDFMNYRHENTDIISYLQPNKLKKYFRVHGINLIINEHSCADHLKFEPGFTGRHSKDNFRNLKDLIDIDMNIDTNEWTNDIISKHKNKMNDAALLKELEHKMILEQVLYDLESLELEYTKNKRQLQELKRKESTNGTPIMNSVPNANIKNQNVSHSAEPSISDLFSMKSAEYLEIMDPNVVGIDIEEIFEPYVDYNENAPIFTYTSSDEDENDIETNSKNSSQQNENITFDVSNFYYWIKMGFIRSDQKTDFENVRKRFPKNFQWILKECALITENDERDLYQELIVLENYFAHVIKPLSILQNDQLIEFQNDAVYRKFNRRFVLILRRLARQW